MGPLRLLRVAPLLLLLASAGCGEATDTASDTSADARSGTRSDADVEPITTQGVAAVVRDALGPERISAYSGAEEDDAVGVEVQLAEGRDILIVMVQTQGDPPPVADCDDLAGTGSG